MQRIETLNNEKNYKKFNFKLLIPFFLITLFLLLFTAFYNKISFTGNVIKNIPLHNKIKIIADLTIPDLELKGDFSHIEIEGNSNSYLQIGDQKFYLGNTKNNYLSFDDFEGEIFFDYSNLSVLKGKTSKIIINGVPIIPNSGDKLKINLEKGFYYDILEINDEVFIDSLSYLTHGNINLDESKNVINIINENVLIEGYQGNLNINNRRFKLNGYINKLEISGDQKISVSV